MTGPRTLLAGFAVLLVACGPPASAPAGAGEQEGEPATMSAEADEVEGQPDAGGRVADRTPAVGGPRRAGEHPRGQPGEAVGGERPTGGGGERRVTWPVPGRVVRAFDPPASPYGAGHRGVKLDAPAGGSVAAAMPGRVSFAGEVAGTGWVTVAHGGGLDTTYGPVDAAVSAGAAVRAGQTLGQLSDGEHRLHWGARIDGEYIDPLSLFARWEVHLAAPAG